MEPEGNLEVSIVREVGKPVFDMARWLRFLGILMIVISVVAVLGVVIVLIASLFIRTLNIGMSELILIGIPVLISIIPVILYIWMGNLLYQAGKMAYPAYMQGDKVLLTKSLVNLKTYFIVLGILTLIGLVVMVLALCLGGLLPIFGITSSTIY